MLVIFDSYLLVYASSLVQHYNISLLPLLAYVAVILFHLGYPIFAWTKGAVLR